MDISTKQETVQYLTAHG